MLRVLWGIALSLRLFFGVLKPDSRGPEPGLAGDGYACSMLVHGIATSTEKMKSTFIPSGIVSRPLVGRSALIVVVILAVALSGVFGATVAVGQTGGPAAAPSVQYSVQGTVASAQGAPVSYGSVTQLNGLLSQLETTSKAAQADLTNLRIERWKADAASKRQALGNVDSIQRNLQNALPEIVEKLRAAPEDVPATFRLYRNLDALYDVLGSVVESTGAFGSKDDLQALANDLKGFEGTRKALAERLENVSAAKEAEIARLRSDLKAVQAAVPAPPPKKIVVDDTEPPKKPAVKKKPAAKPGTSAPSTTKPPAAKPAAGQTPAAAPQPKPQ